MRARRLQEAMALTSRHPPLAASLILAALALGAAVTADAQVAGPNPYQSGARAGEVEGHSAGREEGNELGHAQALIESWMRGFHRGIESPVESLALRDTAEEGESQGRRPGLAAGLEVGHARGRAAASEAYAELRGRPEFRSEAPQAPPPSPPAPAFEACDDPETIRLALPWGRRVTVDPKDAERRGPPIRLDVPEADLPSQSTLRSRAAREGWQDTAAEAWADSYRDSYRRSFHDAFVRERMDISWSERSRWEDDGARSGRREGERRRTCEEYGRAHERGYATGFDDGFDRAYEEGWREASRDHDDSAIIRVREATLDDASEDGVFEPSEDVEAAMTLVNAGMVDAGAPVARWRGVLSAVGSGSIDGPLAAQSQRNVSFDAGSVDAGAPLGATVVVEVEPLNGEASSLTARVGRPVVIDSVTAFLDAREGALVAVVRPVVRSVATRLTDRELHVDAEGVSASVPPVEAGALRDVELVLPARADDLGEARTGETLLLAGSERWMSASFGIDTQVDRGVELASRLDRADGRQGAALAVLATRLRREMDAAMTDPKMYKRLESGSDLARYAQALSRLPPGDRAVFEASISHPLLVRAEDRSVPRRVRKAVRDALEPGR